LFRIEKLAEVALAAENHVADDEKAPFVADRLQREVDRAARSRVVHPDIHSPKTGCIVASEYAGYNQLRNATRLDSLCGPQCEGTNHAQIRDDRIWRSGGI